MSDVTAANEQLKLLWLACGESDFLLRRNQQFVGWLADHKVRHIYRQTAGGHEWSVWRRNLAEFLQLFAVPS